jgi:hypothetical protein
VAYVLEKLEGSEAALEYFGRSCYPKSKSTQVNRVKFDKAVVGETYLVPQAGDGGGGGVEDG